MKTTGQIDALDNSVLDNILKRSERGESISLAIRDMELDLMPTLEALKRHHSDDVKKAKESQRTKEKKVGCEQV